MNHIISPSLLSADFGNLQKDIEMINQSDADWFHLDIMDGVFVPNISFGFPIIKFVKKHAKKPLDVHLMIVDPDRYIEDFRKVGADLLTVHYEACNHLHRTVQNIKSKEMKAGVSLNPHTPVHLLKDIIADLDLVLLMSVNPGFGGQKFIPNTINKIRCLDEYRKNNGLNYKIQIDGGIDKNRIGNVAESGCDIFVAGSSIFQSDDITKAARDLKQIIENY